EGCRRSARMARATGRRRRLPEHRRHRHGVSGSAGRRRVHVRCRGSPALPAVLPWCAGARDLKAAMPTGARLQLMSRVNRVIALAAELSDDERRIVVDAIAPKESREELAQAWTAEIEKRAARVRATATAAAEVVGE